MLMAESRFCVNVHCKIQICCMFEIKIRKCWWKRDFKQAFSRGLVQSLKEDNNCKKKLLRQLGKEYVNWVLDDR